MGDWTDITIIPHLTPRRSVHLTELYDAYRERHKILNATETKFKNTWALKTFYYNTGKTWGSTYPKADPAHWPPNQSPDNEVRNNHVGFLHSLVLLGRFAYGYSADWFWRKSFEKQETLTYFADLEDVLTTAIGATTYTDDGSVNPFDGPDTDINVRDLHVTEMRSVIEVLKRIIILPTAYENRLKTATGTDADDDTAWAAAKTDYAGNSWGSWVSRDPSYDPVVPLGYAKHQRNGGHTYNIYTRETRLTFDLDIEISGLDWNLLPPISARLTIYGAEKAGGSADYTEWADNGVLLKCEETSDTITLGSSDAATYQVLCSDVTDDIGSGHGSEKYILNSVDNWDSSALDKLRPAQSLAVGEDAVRGIQTQQDGDYIFAIIVEPNWKYGNPTTQLKGQIK